MTLFGALSRERLKGLVFVFFGIILGAFFITIVKAQTATIQACVASNGQVKIVNSQADCKINETYLVWNVQGPSGPPGSPGPSGPPGTGSVGGFINNDFSNKALGCTIGIAGCTGLRYRNFANANFSNGLLNQTDFGLSNLSGANFSGATMQQDYLNGVNATGANFSSVYMPGANLYDGDFTVANFTNANLSNVIGYGSWVGPQTKLVNANFTNANLIGFQNLSLADLTGVVWSNTTCPDGTNSNSHGGTCINNLHP